MNVTHSFINLFVLRGKDGTVIRWRISALVILSLAVLLLALGAYVRISASESSAPTADLPVLSENPELKVARRYAEGAFTGTNPWAVNPELKYSQRYTASVLDHINTLYGGSSPELRVHQRFIETSERADALAFQVANPEVKIHRRLVELSRETASADFLAENPEIKVLRRFREVNQ